MAKINLTRTVLKKLVPVKDTILVYDMEFKERLSRGGLIILDDDTSIHGAWDNKFSAIPPDISVIFETAKP